MYDCLRSENEPELGNKMSGILRKTNKQTCILVCPCMYMCMRSESESASHSSPPQLKGDCVGLSSTHTHTQATLKTQANTCQEMVENTQVSKYSTTRNKHTHWSDESPAKMSGGRTDNWLLFKPSPLYGRETEI
jgi:hypothetical protein